jgi:hypothetical protein
MANRAARLHKETQLLHVRTLELEALKKVKARKKKRSTPGLFPFLGTVSDPVKRTSPSVLRRKNVNNLLQTNPLFFLTVVMYCERPNRRAYLSHWSPPRTQDGNRVYQSFCERVMAKAPLKGYHNERLRLLASGEWQADTVFWLSQFVVDPSIAPLLPEAAPVFLKKLLTKVFEVPEKLSLQVALRYAQADILGAPKPLTEFFAACMPTFSPLGEKYLLEALMFFIAHFEQFTQKEIHQVLTFVANPFKDTDYRIERHIKQAKGWPELKFTEPHAVLAQVDSWQQSIAEMEKSILGIPFPKPSLPQKFTGSGIHDGMVICRLCNELELMKEGSTLHHCVATYAYYCHRNEGSIWSLRVNGEPYATIQLDQHRNVVQFKGKHNSRLRGKYAEFLRLWVKKNKLRYVRW